ncbi:hydantoinase/carbamoylase family amidase [Sporomusa termitida]|uniref:Putative hydrolase n=1 Tax=Sporomusa termitida TaxID=2377 RepID=A0A517DU79_9FIRM|nr:hydantoinase/carbamoylase family amidase [Sporomusa termitida]QDR80901.1 putative hydrolase [Sporomusa termitida]
MQANPWASEWVLENLEQVAQCSREQAGTSRRTVSNAGQQVRCFITELMHDLGLVVHTDAAGNMIGRCEPAGSQAALPAVMTGSQLDAIPVAGNYDGIVGVLCSLAAVKTLRERGAGKHPLEVVVFAGEAPGHCNLANLGSKAMAGLVSEQAWKRSKEQADPAEAAALAPDFAQIRSAARPKNSIKAFLALHTEQGRILEQGRVNIGIVENIAAPTRLKMTVNGLAGPAGGILLAERQDALVSAAMIVLAVRNIAAEHDYQGTVATVTTLKTYPGTPALIPAVVEMWVEINGTKHESIIAILQAIKDEVSMIADDHDTPVAIEVISSEKPFMLDQTIVSTLESVCQGLKLSSLRLDDRIGYDVVNMAHLAPAGLILIPGGETAGNGSRRAAQAAIGAGVDVLTAMLQQLAK